MSRSSWAFCLWPFRVSDGNGSGPFRPALARRAIRVESQAILATWLWKWMKSMKSSWMTSTNPMKSPCYSTGWMFKHLISCDLLDFVLRFKRNLIRFNDSMILSTHKNLMELNGDINTQNESCSILLAQKFSLKDFYHENNRVIE